MSTSTMKSKVVAISGGAGGIGFELAQILANEGAILSLADSNSELLDKAAQELGRKGIKLLATQLDVRDQAQVDSWIQETVKAFGRLDGAANLAGVLRPSGPVSQTKNEDWEFIFGINVMGTLNCMRAEINAMTEGASIVNAGSVASLKGTPQFAAYGASKHAVLGMTRTAAIECGPNGIRVNAICPGIVRTTMITDQEAAMGSTLSYPANIPLRRSAQPHEPARLIRFLLSDDSSFINGAAQVIDGGYTIR